MTDRLAELKAVGMLVSFLEDAVVMRLFVSAVAMLLATSALDAHAENSAWAILGVQLGPPAKALPCAPKLLVVRGFPSTFSCNYSAPGGKVYLDATQNGEVVSIIRVQYITKDDASPDMILEKAESYYGQPSKKGFQKLSYQNAVGDELNIEAKSCAGIDCSSGPYGATHYISYVLSNPLKKQKAQQDASKAADEQRQDQLKTQRF